MTGARGPHEHETVIIGGELARLADHELCELVDGRIVPMSPTNPEHGRIEMNVAAALRNRMRCSNRDMSGDGGRLIRGDGGGV